MLDKRPTPRVTELEDNIQNQTTVNMGDEKISDMVTGLIRGLSARKKNTYRIEWEGSRIPRGAIINGQEITWTQHGIVYAADGQGYGKEIGYYERVVDDLSQTTQVMLVFAD